MVLPSPAFVRATSLGHVNLAADFYWLKLIQYYGYHFQTDQKYPYFYSIAQLVTDLDPKYSFVYYFSAFVLSYDLQKPDLALQYLEKGIKNNPDNYILYNQAGFISYFYLKNSLMAADYFEKGGMIPGAPPDYLLIARLLREKGLEKKTVKLMWMNQYKNARDPITRRRAEIALIKLQMTEEIDEINRALYRFHQAQGRFPENLQMLVEKGLIRVVPRDPLGRPYLYDRMLGIVKGEPVEPGETSQ